MSDVVAFPARARPVPLAPRMQPLAVRGLCLRLGQTAVLDDVSFDLSAAGCTVVMGANGAGKSLFLRLVHGILAPDAGAVTWAGTPAQQCRSSRGFVFQSTPVLRRSVAANVEIAASGDRKARAAATASALERVGLTSRGSQPAATLSGGEKQRMALARALVAAPRLILLDEPSASLDRRATERFEAILTEIRAEGVGIILATHDLFQAKRLADHVLLFSEGRLVDQADGEVFFGASASDAARSYLAYGEPQTGS